jgi:type VI secretion system protein ImpL
MKRWIVLTISIIAILILCALIWFVFPIIAFAGVAPFENMWLRLALIVLLLAGYFGWLAYKIYRHRQSAQELADNISVQEPEDDGSDAGVLAEKMQDALITLKGAQRTKGDFLYELPWYLIVGPPGAGKTTALMNCGLKFPIAAHAAGPIAGSGGTRYCDWWFTEDAVFLDTAGRYTTQDSDADTDRKSWLAFLDLLKKHRTRQPINGVLVAVSIGDLIGMNQGEVAAHAVAIRKRLAELNNRLQVDFPVYVLFTKADLLAGFMEYFGNLDEAKRKAVWGATFQTSKKKENRVADVGPEIDLLISRLTAELPDRLQEEPDPVSRVKLLGLPSQVSALKPVVIQFLNQIFEPTRYQTSATLRGFYFTSGTQEGTPVDRVLGSLSRSLGISASSPAYSGRAKSFFLENLLTKVVFGEAGWVSTNARAVRRSLLLRSAGYSLVGIVTAAVLGGWAMSYLGNSSLIRSTDAASDAYATEQAKIITQDPIDDTDFQKITAPLNALAGFPRGFANAEASVPMLETLGLGLHKRLSIQSVAAYRTGLDRLLRPRLILHLEKRLADLQEQPGELYQPLKVYMMLGGDPAIPVDTALIQGFMGSDWGAIYPGQPNKATRDALQAHLAAMLDLNTGTMRLIPLNGNLVTASQTALGRLSLAERAFALIASGARGGDVKDWTVVGKGGPDAAAVFGTTDGSPVEALGVQALYTYDGFYALFLDKMESVIKLLDDERWVMGPAGVTDSFDKQIANLGPDLFRIYDQEHAKAWQAALGRLRLNSFVADKPDYNTLLAATGVQSPIKLLLESVAAETKLTEAKPEAEEAAEGEGALDKAAEKLGNKAASKLKSKIPGKLKSIAEIGLDANKKSEGRGGEVQPAFVPGSSIQDRFRRFHELTAAEGGKSQVDLLIEQLKGLRQALVDEQSFEQAPAARQSMVQFLSALSTSASRLEDPFTGMFKTALADVEQKIVGQRLDSIEGSLSGSVTRACRDTIGKKYPFSAKSKDDVPLGAFAKVFGPNGVFDAFFKENLAGLVDTSGKTWVAKGDSKLSQQLSEDTLRQFQSAARIKDAFFGGQGSAPNVKFAIVVQSMSQQTPSVTFEVNGATLESPFGVESRGDFEWPGSSPDGTASITIPGAEGGAGASIKFQGPWALHRLLNAGQLRQSGNKATVRFVIKGREVTYQLTFDTLDNPFTLIQQVKFACPSDLQE